MFLKRLSYVIRNILVITISALLINCSGEKEAEEVIVNPAFSSTISAFTSGLISNESGIRIRLAQEIDDSVDFNVPIDMELFSFSPKIKGDVFWLDNQTIEFRPESRLSSGTTFNVKFYISKLIDVPDDMKVFEFQFQTINQNFLVNVDGFKTYTKNDLTWNKIIGTVSTADIIDDLEIEKILFANQGRTDLDISWQHGSDGKTHTFQVDSVERKEKAEKVTLEWKGKIIEIDNNDKTNIEIPAIGDFTLMDIKIVQQPEQYMLLQFSEPLLSNQNLDGLIRLEGSPTLSFIVDENEILVYPPVRQMGTMYVYIEKGIKNILGYKLKEEETLEITFEEINPAVRLLGKGVILPNSEGLIFPFEAVNLKAVDVKIIKIYENNISQFLQVNYLDGSDQLVRAGRLLKKKTINLISEKPIDYGKWNTFFLDLSELIQNDPGALYRIELGFKQTYSLFPCGDLDDETEIIALEEFEEEEDEENWDGLPEDESSYWDYYDDYYYEDSWEERDNPCHAAYYGERRSVSRNVLSSDLGIIVKTGNNKSMMVAISDLVTTQPLSNVQIEVLNFQKQLIATVQTDNEGLAELKFDTKPFLLIATYGKQKGYLKLDDGSSLSLSKFDVYGNVVQDGLKGYIYGERGVWRPGDSLFLMFILEDAEQLLPENHPVSFELINPLGQVTRNITKTIGTNSFYNFTTNTEPDDPTGNWTAKIQVGGTTFYKALKIETIKPNRLKIELDFGVDKITAEQDYLEADMKVTWLHGAIARNLYSEVSVSLNQAKTSFSRYPDYIFEDPVRQFYTEEYTIYDGYIDNEGNARIRSSIYAKDAAPGMLNASILARVYEEGGDFSINQFTIPYAPYESFVGIKTPKGDIARGMLLTDTNHVVNIVTVDHDGKSIGIRKNLEVTVYKVRWKWWWDTSEDNFASYIGNSYNAPVQRETITTTGGEGKFTFRINYPEWGRYLIRIADPVSGHITGKTVYVDWPGWAGRAQREDADGATMLTFNADKEKYQVGEYATINLPSGGNGRALVSIESGSKVIDAFWIETLENENTFNFTITEEMAPNAYVNISLIQPHSQSANDLPIRLYGVIPIFVEDPQTVLSPEITMPDILTPDEFVTIKVSEKNKLEMTYTLAVVDDGLLDLTRFRTPDPWNIFYAREALGVKTWDMYDMVMGAYGGRIEQLFSIGGDEEAAGEESKSKAKRFKPMVKFFGPFNLKAGRSNPHTFKMPQYIGSVRTMVIAGDQSAYGAAEKTTPVKKPLMVIATMPRVVGPGESVKLPVTVFAMEDNITDVNIEIVPNEFLILQDENKKSLSFSSPGDKTINFDFLVASMLGVGNITVLATSGSEKSEYNIEIQVRNPNPKITDLIESVIEPGNEWSHDYSFPGMIGTNSGLLEVSNIPPIDIGRRINFLIEYPHGCIEQTTSAAFPQLFLDELLELENTRKDKIQENVTAAIKRLNTFMLPSGGLGYWPNSSEESDWGTSYAGHFMLEAEARGYSLPVNFKKNWQKYQRKAARRWSPVSNNSGYSYQQNDLIQAYRLYTLALANSPELGAMNRLRESDNISQQAKWRLAAAYALAGQPEAGKELILGSGIDIDEYEGFSESFGSAERDRAMILESMILMGERNAAVQLMKTISSDLSSNEWMSTQTTAYCLLSISKFVGSDGTSKELEFSYSLNNEREIKASTKMSISHISLNATEGIDGSVNIKNTGEGIIFARLILEGIPEVGDQSSAENNLQLDVSYRDMNGYSLDVSQLEQGTDFMAIVTVKNPGLLYNYKDIALTQIFPSGWEILNTRMFDFSSGIESDIPKYQDIRDDRVYTYFDLDNYRVKKFVILLNAAYLGEFYLPTTYGEAMYNNMINARIPGMWVEIISPGN